MAASSEDGDDGGQLFNLAARPPTRHAGAAAEHVFLDGMATERDTTAARAIVLFDGVCSLCNGTVDLLLRLDRPGRLRLAPLQSRPGRELMRAHDLPPDQRDTLVVIAGGRAHVRSEAALAIAAALPAPWSALRWLRAVPRRWRDALYDAVARRRLRWFGQRDRCRLPTAADRARFLPGADEIVAP
jgi:predicted DCC family thiol-disulfide oxidoreductase YuxK